MQYFVGGAISLAVASFLLFLRWRAKRPKLVLNGSGSGGGYYSITFLNWPWFWGFSVERATPTITSAQIRMLGRKRRVGPPLTWDLGTGEYARQIEIKVGTSARLLAFALEPDQSGYYVPGSRDEEPPQHRRTFSDDERDFEIILQDTIRRTYRFRITVWFEKGNVRVARRLTLHGRLLLLKDAASYLKSALFDKY